MDNKSATEISSPNTEEPSSCLHLIQQSQQWRLGQIFAFLTKPCENHNVDHHNPNLSHSLVAWIWRIAAILESVKPVILC